MDTARSAFFSPVADSGRVRMMSKDEATKVQPVVFDAYRRGRPGELSRNDKFWEVIFLDRERWRGGASAHFHVVHENAAGEADGYARYRMKEAWDDGLPTGSAAVMELVSLTSEADAALWRFLLDLDLIRTVESPRRPVDDTLLWRLADSRAYRTTYLGDWLWVRVLDTVAALSARRYATEGSLVLEVVDPFRPDGPAAGTFRLEGSPDGATCTRVSAVDPDLTLDVVALGSAFLGGVPLSSLAEAGRLQAKDQATLSKADLLFRSTPTPYCSTPF